MYTEDGGERWVEEDLSWLGAPPEQAPTEVRDAWLEQEAEDHAAWKASLDPWTRFEVEQGVPATAEHGFALPEGWMRPTLQDVAELRQDALLDLEGSFRRADAARTTALLDAYESSMRDLADRFGASYGLRTGVGAQSFFSTTGLRLGMHPLRVAHLLDTATTCRDRFPRTWQRYVTGDAGWRAIHTAVQQAEGLDEQHWAAYDEGAAGRVATSTRLKDALRKLRERLQDDTAPARAKAAAARRGVRLEEGADGQASLVVTGPAADIVAIDQALSRAAIASHHKDETRTVGQLRHDILVDLALGGFRAAATPGALVPARPAVGVQLVLTIPALAWLGRTAEQAQLAGYGPIDLETARRLAAGAKSLVRVLTDPITGVRLAMDRRTYRPPEDLRRWVGIRDQHCRFPGCRRPESHADRDHAEEWRDAGLTEAGNLVTVCRPHHDAKTRRLQQEELLATGTVTWTDPWGHVFEDPPPDPMAPAPADLLPDDPTADAGTEIATGPRSDTDTDTGTGTGTDESVPF